MDSNPAVKAAWDESVKMVDAGISAKLKSFSNEWNAGFKNGAFATVACPAWMTGYITEQAGDGNAGKWDIASVPGGGGNWGGSFLAVPTVERPPGPRDQAGVLPDQRRRPAVRVRRGREPAVQPDALRQACPQGRHERRTSTTPRSARSSSPGARDLQPAFLGAKNQPVRDAVENALRSVESGQRSSEEGWAAALKDGETAAG